MSKTMIATRIDDGLLKQFDAWAAGQSLPRTRALERAMRLAVNGQSRPVPLVDAMQSAPRSIAVPAEPARRILGYHPISNAPIYEGEK